MFCTIRRPWLGLPPRALSRREHPARAPSVVVRAPLATGNSQLVTPEMGSLPEPIGIRFPSPGIRSGSFWDPNGIRLGRL